MMYGNIELIKSKVELVTEDDPLKKIELAGRTCYKSEDKITADSANKFVQMLYKREHWAMLEHAQLFFESHKETAFEELLKHAPSSFVNITCHEDKDTGDCRTLVSGNIRAFLDCDWIKLDPYASNPVIFDDQQSKMLQGYGFSCARTTLGIPDNMLNQSEKLAHRYMTLRFTCDRGVSHELVRHRPCSFAQESTRYVNYQDRQIQFIEPANWESGWAQQDRELFIKGCQLSAETYATLLANGKTPQQARAMLPNALKTEIVVTANDLEWLHIFDLRCSPAAHPDMQRVAYMAKSIYENLRGVNVYHE